VTVHKLSPIAYATPIIDRQDHISLVKKILVKAVVYAVVLGRVPAIAILQNPIAMDPDNSRISLFLAETLRLKQEGWDT